MKGQPFIKRLGFALKGIALTFRRESSFRTHVLVAVGVLVLLCIARPAPVWWAIVVVVTGLVLLAELFNSALETLTDHLHPDQHPEIGVAKDMAAGAVLVASAIAVLVGIAFVVAWWRGTSGPTT